MLNAIVQNSKRFRRDEDGALIIFGLIFFVLMVMMGGFAIDLMRYENTRTMLQNTLDRSTLAAAALNQTRDPEAVVRDYVLKAGLIDQLKTVDVTDALNSRTVHTVGRADTHPIFMHMLGINSFDALGRSTATQGISNVEIALVLDISGSMNEMGGAKIQALREAASGFVDTVLANDVNHRVSITVVPYNAQVNLGPKLASKFNLTHVNGVAHENCVEIPRTAFNDLALSRTEPMPVMAYADYWYGTDTRNVDVSPTSGAAVPNYNAVFCKPNAANEVILPSNNATVLKARINALQAEGNTSITLGMKWGVTMLDPSMQGMYSEFIASGDIPASMPSRPFAYDGGKSMKIVVLMTDGQHVRHTRITDDYKTGPSGIYLSAGDNHYSVHFTAGRPPAAGTNEYWVPHLAKWQATPWTSNATPAVQQDWKDIWAHLKTTYVAWQFYARALGPSNGGFAKVYNDTMASMVQTYAMEPDMDASLNQTCTLAKDAGVTVFGIAVMAPVAGQNVIRNCSTDGRFFNVSQPDDMLAAFAAIASNITMLRLTQ